MSHIYQVSSQSHEKCTSVLHKLEKNMRTNQQDTDNDPKPATDIVTNICPIAILLYMY